MSINPRELRVLEVVDETADARSIVLCVPDGLGTTFEYRPGQFLTMRIPSEETGSVARSYSLSSAPGIDRHLKVTVKRTAGGYGSNWLCDNIRAGDTITVLPPSGLFTPHSLDVDLLLFAAGSGITPVMSILKAALHGGSGKALLFYANRAADSVIFDAELRRLRAEHPERLAVEHWLDDEHGVLDPARIEKVARSVPTAEVFTCGPAAFMDIVGEGVTLAGVPRSRTHREVFTSLTGDPFAVVGPDAGERAGTTGGGAASSAGQADAVVHIGGETHEFGWDRDRTLVDVLLERGVDVPYSCRSGECGSCACNLVRGEVAMEKSDILDPEDIADGYILGCQSRPVSGSVEISF